VGSERAGQTVFEYAVSANALPSTLQYVALGHLHRQQRVGAPVPAWYSGSPLQLDFGEVDDTKGVLLVDVAAGRPAQVREVALRAGRRLHRAEGTVAQLAARADDVADAWVKAVVTEAPRAGLADEVRAVLPGAVEVVVPTRAPVPVASRERTGRSPQELFAEFVVARGLDDARLVPMFAELYDEVLAAGGGT
jgi:exonuclease SbcD